MTELGNLPYTDFVDDQGTSALHAMGFYVNTCNLNVGEVQETRDGHCVRVRRNNGESLGVAFIPWETTPAEAVDIVKQTIKRGKKYIERYTPDGASEIRLR